jgi:hypothetical protein
MEGGDNMNKRKYLVSSMSMILMLFFVVTFQTVRIAGLSFLEQTTSANDLIFIVVSVFCVLFITILFYYVPMLLVFEVSFNLCITLSPEIYISIPNRKINKIVVKKGRRYLRLNVIRC